MSQLEETQHLKIAFEVIKEGTEGFRTLIGKGGYGHVYKGKLLISGQLTTVAVKRLHQQFGQGLKEFLTEIELLKNQKHPNLISLIGYCDEGNEKIIIYEYAAHGSLDRYMWPNTATREVSWLERLRICVHIARGLYHLHNQGIIHRDIKSANILLDSGFVAKISDLGLSKLSPDAAAISQACGTSCYVDPEYMTTALVTTESDVYSFGMVLLEILCGRLCYIKDRDGNLLSYYHQMKKLNTVIDPNLRQHMRSDSLIRFLSIAYGCLNERKQRHSMRRVLKELEEALEIEKSQDGKESLLVSSNDSQGWFSEFPFSTYVTRRTNVAKIFDIFDLNKDGGLSKKEVAAFLFVTKDGKEQLSTFTDEVFSLYHKYIDGKKGFTYHGLLQYYDDGHSDLDSDVVSLLSESDVSNKRKKLMWLFGKLNSYKDDGLNGQEYSAASHKSLLKKIGSKRGLITSSSLLTKDDNDVPIDQSDLYSEMLDLLLKPDDDDDDEAASLITSPQRSDIHENEIVALMILFSTLFTVLTAMVLVKLKYLLVLFLILFNSTKVYLAGR